MATKKLPQRWKRVCIKCGNSFSTHSTDREDCYKCRKKCNEIHHFNMPVKAKTEKTSVTVKVPKEDVTSQKQTP